MEKKKVLLIEDDLDLSNLYKEYLTAAKFDVITARDKEEGLKLALQEKVDFILLDVMLAEDSSGLDLLRDLRASEKDKETPVVMLTNVAKDEEKKMALNLGAKEYLVKASSKPKEIVKTVKKYTGTLKDSEKE